MMNNIQNVSGIGIEYVDDEGNLKFIDFHACYRSYLKMHYGDEFTEMDLPEFERTSYKCVGQRDLFTNPPYIELFTDPPTRFEFSSKDGFYELQRQIHKARWRTMDLS
ncbi:MAG: hypothetical protein KF716_08175 [Anaerolineae bacterium]|nr:hypothetical protein [Anaerolineae bacterium]